MFHVLTQGCVEIRLCLNKLLSGILKKKKKKNAGNTSVKHCISVDKVIKLKIFTDTLSNRPNGIT